MKFEDYLDQKPGEKTSRKKLLLIGDSSIRRVVQNDTQRFDVDYFESLSEIMYNRPKGKYDCAVVGYRENDRAAVEAARVLSSFFRTVPIYLVTIVSPNNEKIMKYEKGSEFSFVRDSAAAMELISSRRGASPPVYSSGDSV